METFKFMTSDGFDLFAWTSKVEDPIADVLIVHGFGEHSSRYTYETQSFNDNQLSVYAYDQRNHGRSDGRLGYIHNFEGMISDLDVFIKEMDLGIHRPFFIFTHSMGGMVTSNYCIASAKLPEKLKGIVFSSPFLMPKADMAPILQKISPIAGKLMPLMKTVEIDTRQISRDPGVRHDYEKDPFVYHGGVYAKTAATFLKVMKKTLPLLNKIYLPILVMYGSDDHLVETQGAVELYKRASSKDKNLVQLEGFKHEITRDIGKEEVMRQILDWITSRVHD